MGNSSTLVMYCVTVSSPSARRVGMTCSIVMEGAPISGVGCHRNQPIEDVPKSCRTCRNARSGRPPLLARMPIAPLGTPSGSRRFVTQMDYAFHLPSRDKPLQCNSGLQHGLERVRSSIYSLIARLENAPAQNQSRQK